MLRKDEPEGPKERILLVDDEVEILEKLKECLEDDYEILTAQTGQEGIDTFEREHPSVIIADIRMPGMDGIELMKRIKGTDKDAEFIVITGHGETETAIQSVKLGALPESAALAACTSLPSAVTALLTALVLFCCSA